MDKQEPARFCGAPSEEAGRSKRTLAIPDQALTVGNILAVHGETDDLRARGQSAFHTFARRIEVRAGVKLEPERPLRRRSDLIDRVSGGGADDHDGLHGALAAHGGRLAILTGRVVST